MIEHADLDALCRAVAPQLAEAARAGIRERGAASMALAGGSTPFPVYRRFAEEPVDWSHLTLLPGDERWVPATHAASNLRAIRETFVDLPVRYAPLVPADPDDTPSLEAACLSLEAVPRPFDACVLGMGSDGHFASLFPGAPELGRALDPAGTEPAVVVRPAPLPEEAPYARVSLTLSAILASRKLMLLIRGEGKRRVLEAAREGDPNEYPIAALLKAAGSALDIHWSP
jgi:6-phosphogluconolactonase